MRSLSEPAPARQACAFQVGDSVLARILREIWNQQHNDTKRLSMLCDAAVGRVTNLMEPRGRFWAHLTRALMSCEARPLADSHADFAIASGLVERVRDPRAARLATVCEATLLMHAGQHAAALEHFARLPLNGKPGRDDADDHFILAGRATCALAVGAVDAGFEALYANLRLSERGGPAIRHWMVAVELAVMLLSIERVDEGMALLEDLLATRPAPTASLELWTRVRHAIARGRMLQRRHDEALGELLMLADCRHVKRTPALALDIRVELAHVYLAQGRMADMRRQLLLAEESAAACDPPRQPADCLLLSARVAHADDRIADAAALLDQALAAFESDPLRATCPQAQVDAMELLSDCHARLGRFDDAYATHRRFFELYRQRSDYVANAMAAATRCARARAAPFEMSGREIDCLRLCAAGKTARETGEILNVSEWTVVYHLERVKRKFGLRRKQQVVARAISLGLIQAQRRQAD
jgi:DNA-binding CsgD family transcriptional regulator